MSEEDVLRENEELRQLVKEYRKCNFGHMWCRDIEGRDSRCLRCIKADALLEPHEKAK